MGQKIHPIGFRIGVIRDWESKWYLDKGYAEALYEDHKIRQHIKKKLANAAISRVEIDRPGPPQTGSVCVPYGGGLTCDASTYSDPTLAFVVTVCAPSLLSPAPS